MAVNSENIWLTVRGPCRCMIRSNFGASVRCRNFMCYLGSRSPVSDGHFSRSPIGAKYVMYLCIVTSIYICCLSKNKFTYQFKGALSFNWVKQNGNVVSTSHWIRPVCLKRLRSGSQSWTHAGFVDRVVWILVGVFTACKSSCRKVMISRYLSVHRGERGEGR